MRTKEPRADKVATVEEIRNTFHSAKATLLTEYRGLTVKEMTNLRRKLREAGGEYHVVKNTLFRRAIGDALTPELEALLVGPTAIAVAYEDPVATAKVVLDFLRELRKPEVAIKGGYLEGRVLEPEEVIALSKIPPRPIVLGQVVGTLQGPLTGFVGTFHGILSEFVRTLQAQSDQRQAA